MPYRITLTLLMIVCTIIGLTALVPLAIYEFGCGYRDVLIIVLPIVVPLLVAFIRDLWRPYVEISQTQSEETPCCSNAQA